MEIKKKKIALIRILFFLLLPVVVFADGEEGAKYPDEVKALPISSELVTVENIKRSEENHKKLAIPDTLGPKKGFLRDAGSFKVELKTGKNGIDVYLLNFNTALPIVESSRVDGQLYVEKKEYDLKFKPLASQRKFFAPWPTSLKAEEVAGKEVSIVLLAVREKLIGAPVLYKLEKLF